MPWSVINTSLDSYLDITTDRFSLRCRTRHYRCKIGLPDQYSCTLIIPSGPGDGKLPKCGRCDIAKKDCTYETGRRFRRSSIAESFSDDQPWVSLPPQSKLPSAQGVDLAEM